ncbi:hypothetical protein J007_05746 [Cryptococcus neoformans]|nr:hypothetical protein J007_05746 [Cryptococcus neoformans var. grubii]OXC58709.1 hypothetical protein C358_05865 [Cryptococcus neoformans var. grubii MW-RSA852]
MPQQSSEQSPVAIICRNSFSIIKLKEFLHPSAPCDTRLADSCLMECIGWLGRVIRLAGQKDGKLYAVEAASGHHCKVAIGWFVGMACFNLWHVLRVKSFMGASMILCHPQKMIWAWLR